MENPNQPSSLQQQPSQQPQSPLPAQAAPQADPYLDVALMMKNKVSKPLIIQNLVSKGIDPQSAAAIVAQVDITFRQVKKKEGLKNMLYGALWCIGGLIVSSLSYESARSGGGTYFVFYGAIVIGGLQFLMGLIQFLGNL